MKKIPYIILLSLLACTCYGLSKNYQHIKLAIFDNPRIGSTPLISQKLVESYIRGIKTAAYEAKLDGITLNYKTFLYGKSLLNILQKVPEVRKWSPDVVIGLHSSNESLISESLFSNKLVLSISASDSILSAQNKNFYSLGVPDDIAAKGLAHFLSTHYSNKNLFIAIGVDNKESVDFKNAIIKIYKEKNPAKKIISSEFISSDISQVNLPNLLKNYKHGDLILLLSVSGTFHNQIELMNKIADYLSPNKIVFVNDVDNWRNNKIPGNTNNTKNPYTALRLDTLFVNKKTSAYKKFSSLYKKLYHKKPEYKISFITYHSVMSIITALKKYPPPANLSTKEAVLWSYHQALKHNSNWFRPMQMVIFKLNGNSETLLAKIKQKLHE